MASLQDLINLAKADGGKFFVIDEKGEAKLVIMSIDDYQKMLLGKLQRQILDVEKINKMITRAQLQEEEKITPEVEIPKSKVAQGPKIEHAPASPRVDLRAEVIDPSFNFEIPKIDDIDDF